MAKLRDIRAISFDADDTLWDFHKVMRHSLKCALEELIKPRPKARDKLTIEAMIRIREEVAEKLKGKVANLEEIRLEAFRETLTRIGLNDDALAEHVNDVYFSHRHKDIQLYDDVLETLCAQEGNLI